MSKEEKLFICEIFMSSPNKQESTTRINDREMQIKYKFDEKTRRDISRIRAQGNWPKYALCVKFYSLYIAKESTIERIKSMVHDADTGLRAINPELSAQVRFFQLSSEDIRESEMYHELIHAIKTQIYGTLLDRFREVLKKDTIPDKTVNSLLEMCDRLRSVNILNDAEITARINQIQAQISARLINPIVSDLESEISRITSGFSFVEDDDVFLPNREENREKSIVFVED